MEQRDTRVRMNKLTSSISVCLSIAATLFLALGFGAFAEKLDPVVVKAKEITTTEAGQVASLPCAPCSGGDPVDLTSQADRMV